MRQLLLILSLGLFSCSQIDESSSNENLMVDSSTSNILITHYDSLNKYTVDFRNSSYSRESFNYMQKSQRFICKTLTNERIDQFGLRSQFNMKKEFFDFSMNKVFEIESNFRKIELKRDYYVTRDLIDQLPDYFELNNYDSQKEFVKCTGQFYSVEIPNGKNKAYFGYRKTGLGFTDTTFAIGFIYYSVNQTENYRLLIRAKNEELYKSIYPLIGINISSKNSNDKFSGWSSFYLWSKEGQDNKKNLTDFDLVLSINYDLSDEDPNNNRKKELNVPIINGLLYGKEAKDGIYYLTIED